MRRKPVYQNQGFRKVVDHYYDEILRRNPIAATWLGENLYDGLLPEVGAEAVEKEISFLHEMKGTFEALGERGLSIDERLDRQLVLYMLQKELFFQEELKRWKLGRDLAVDIGDSLFMLYIRDSLPLTTRVESMISRLKAAPMYLFSGRTLFQDTPPLWCEKFLDSAERLPALLDSIARGINKRVPDFLMAEFNKASAALKKALGEHITWFRNAIIPKAKGDWALGSGAFFSLLLLRKLGMDSRELLELGDFRLREAKSRQETLSRNIVSNANLKEASLKVRKHAPPSFKKAIEAYREAVNRSRAFVEMKKFATLPDDE